MRDFLKRLLTSVLLFAAVSASAGVWMLNPDGTGAPFDGDMNCQPLTDVQSQTDCNGCPTHYPDGAIGVPSGVIVYGCDSNSPNVGDMVCSNEVYTTSELAATSSGGFWSGTEHRFLRYVCREWDGDSWEVVDNQDVDGTVNIHGNLILMSGWGTNIIDSAARGNILAGTNNGTIYLGPKAMGNSIHVRVTSGPGSYLHVGTNSSYNIIQGVVDGATIRIDNNVLYNRLSFLADQDPCLRVRDNVFNSDIHALNIDGGVGSGWDVGNITNCSIRGVGANPYATYSASNLMGCTISTPTNVANLANAVVADSVRAPSLLQEALPTLVFRAHSETAQPLFDGTAATNVEWEVSDLDTYSAFVSNTFYVVPVALDGHVVEVRAVTTSTGVAAYGSGWCAVVVTNGAPSPALDCGTASDFSSRAASVLRMRVTSNLVVHVSALGEGTVDLMTQNALIGYLGGNTWDNGFEVYDCGMDW